MKYRILCTTLSITLFLVFLLPGCAPVDSSVSQPERSLSDALKDQNSPAREPLKIQRLTAATSLSIPKNEIPSPDVYIIVHPAYSLFFREASKSHYSDAKFALLSRQFDEEERFIIEASQTDKIVILIIPGNYKTESVSTMSYATYLNTVAFGKSVFYLFSESPNNGSVSMNDMVDLYRFLQGVNAKRVLIGGGYIGRCQREFYSEFTKYFDKSVTYIMPEISTISPEDISEGEAAKILESIQRHDYAPVEQFIDKKQSDASTLLSTPQIQ